MPDFFSSYSRKKPYIPNQKEPYSLSRSKIELFTQCPRCFWMDVRLGIGRPSIPAFTLNNAVDSLLKNEFDLLRDKGESHELHKKFDIDCVPLKHPDLPKWRGEVEGYKYIGASCVHKATNFKLTGMIDDLWQNKNEELVIVDYKATSSDKEFDLNDKWKKSYVRQIEFYQWLFRQMGFSVSNEGYFVVANAGKNRANFDGKLEFNMSIVGFTGSDKWIEKTLLKVKETLDGDAIPEADDDCEYCRYRRSAVESVTAHLKKTR